MLSPHPPNLTPPRSRRHPEVKQLPRSPSTRAQRNRRALRGQLHTHARRRVLRADGAPRGILLPGGEWVRAAGLAVKEPEFLGVGDRLGGEVERRGAAVGHDEVLALEVNGSDDIRPRRAPAELETEVGHLVVWEAEDGGRGVAASGCKAPFDCTADDGCGHALEVGVAAWGGSRDGSDKGEGNGGESGFHFGM